MQLKLYQLFSIIAGPIIDLWLMKRKIAGKEDPKRFPERLGHAGFPRFTGSLVWIHAASVGEAMSVLPLVEAMIREYQDINVLVTTGTVTSANVIEGRLPARAFHQYAPIDKIITVRRFLSHWKPDCALWVESELWPNLIMETHATGCSMIQINARISLSSYKKWRKYNSLAEKMLSCFALSLAQSEEDKKRLVDLGTPNAKFIGNLKFDAQPLPADPKETGKLVNIIGERPIWIAASTHPNEEEIIADAHIKLKVIHKNLLTIIIPRHPVRGKDISDILTRKKLTSVLRSTGDDVPENIDIYIADTIGELGIFYRLSGIVFMGGSLVKHGGQNPLEAARLECAVITGPNIENFVRIYSEMKEAKAGIFINNSDELADEVDKLLIDHELQEKYSTTAKELIQSKSGGVIESYMSELSPYLKSLSRVKKSDEVQSA